MCQIIRMWVNKAGRGSGKKSLNVNIRARSGWQPGEVYPAGKMGRARRTISRKEEEKKE
jgi:hypothetical protein